MPSSIPILRALHAPHPRCQATVGVGQHQLPQDSAHGAAKAFPGATGHRGEAVSDPQESWINGKAIGKSMGKPWKEW